MFALKPLALSVALCMTIAEAWPSQSYKSVPFVTPVCNVTKSGRPLAPGYLFLTTTSAPYPASIIITDEGELVWASQSGDYTNLNGQTLDSKPVLTYWNGTGSPNPQTAGHGYGSVYILDSTYTVKYSLCPDLDLAADGPISRVPGRPTRVLYHGSWLAPCHSVQHHAGGSHVYQRASGWLDL
jgi:hypothetical protein